MGLMIGGFVASVVGLALLGFSAWLHQPGFAGDPNVRLLDGGAFGIMMVLGAGCLVAGAVLIVRGARRHTAARA